MSAISIIYANANDFGLTSESNGGSYSVAAEGTGNFKIARSNTQLNLTQGQTLVTSTYWAVNQGCYEFDTTSLPSGSHKVTLAFTTTGSATDGGITSKPQEAFVNNWDGTFAGSFLTASALASLTTFAVGAPPGAPNSTYALSGELSVPALSAWKITVAGQDHRLGIAPTGLDRTVVHTTDATGTTNDPKLTAISGDQVTYVGAGAGAFGTGAISPSYPSGLQNGDILLLVVETASQALPAITGWADVITPPETPPGNTTTSTRLTVRWFRYTGSGTSVAVGDSGDHQIARVFAFRGCVATGDPWDVTNTGTDASTGTTVTFPAVTTTVDGCMIVNAVALGDDAAATMSSETNANLVGLEQVAFDGTTAGNDGQIGVIVGYKETAGSVGSTTATISIGLHKALATIALKPEVTSSGPTTHAGAATLSGTGTRTAAGKLQGKGASGLTATGTLTANGKRRTIGAATVAGAGSVIANGQTLKIAASAVAGSGAQTATARLTAKAAAGLAGTGAQSAAALVTRSVAANLPAAGTLSATAELIGSAVTHDGASAFVGSGTATAAALLTKPGVAALSGTGAFTAAGTVEEAQHAGAASLGGSGTVAAAATTALRGAAAVAGAGSLTAAAAVEEAQHAGSASLAGSGALAAAANVTRRGAATLAGIGSFTAAATVQEAQHEGAAGLAGASSFAATAEVTRPASAALAGAGTTAISATLSFDSSATLTGVSTATAASSLNAKAASQLAGASSLTALASTFSSTQSSAVFQGAGSLAAAAALTQRAQGALSGAGAAGAYAGLTLPADGALVGAGGLSAAGGLQGWGSSALAGQGTLLATAATSSALAAQAALIGAGTSTTTALVRRGGGATFSGASQVAVLATVELRARSILTGNAGLQAATRLETLTAALLAGVGIAFAAPTLRASTWRAPTVSRPSNDTPSSRPRQPYYRRPPAISTGRR